MRDVEGKISQLIKRQFPSFYMEEGADFVSFVEAYYEWLESNYQELTLKSNTNFVAGDTVTQGNTTGTILTVNGSNIIVSVNNFDAFRCNVLCNEFVTVTSSSGGNSYIEIQKKLNPLHWGRKLFTIRDVDRTLDQFIGNFKEKYLKNIEFDTNTNKRLLIKNSYDLYRSKGTERSVDLFFRLVYGSSAKVYYPGDDIMRLSAAEWTKPQYLEVTPSARTIGLVGKQITGLTSGATAFVEKFIKRRIRGGFVYVLYLSNIKGEFVNEEMLKGSTFFSDLPTVRGSLTSATVTIGGTLFSVGDIVTFVSLHGDEAKARVAAIDNDTGVVDFTLLDGGYGYTVSAPSADFTADELADRSQSIVSNTVLTLSNVEPGNTVSGFVITSGGSGYANSDTITVASDYTNATATVNTDGSGVITDIHVTNVGSGFFSSSPTVTITTSGGTSADIAATTRAPESYFRYFEPFTQRLATLTVNTESAAINSALFADVAGNNVVIGNSTVNEAFGTVLSVESTTPATNTAILKISVANNGLFAVANTLTISGTTTTNGVIDAITNTSVTANVMGIPDKATFTVSALTGIDDFITGNEVFQEDEQSSECANATIVISSLSGSPASGTIDVDSIQGVFRNGRTIKVRDTSSEGTVDDVQLTVGLYETSASFVNTFNAPVFSSTTGTVANVAIVSEGTGAAFRVGSITEAETIFLNTDLITSNATHYLPIAIAATAYGFPKNPSGNSSSVIFDCLTFDSFSLGTISTLTEINPGTDYTVDPYVLVHQPYISTFDKHDYIMEIENLNGAYIDGEKILQTNTLLSKTTIVVGDETGLAVGEKVLQGSANGIVDTIQADADTIIVKDVNGTFAVNATPLTSASNGSFTTSVTSVSTNSSITSTAKGLIKSSNASHIIVKRIQFDNLFQETLQVVGQSSGATANIVTIEPQLSTLQIGFNANVEANVVTANGTVTSLEITDSGAGYRDNEEMTFVSADGLRTGSAIGTVSGYGTGTGYYKTEKGFLSDDSKIHDSDFYQEYSYEVLSRIPLERYAEMFKKVMHTSGTRFFGGVLIETDKSANIAYTASGQSTLDPVDATNFNAASDVAGEVITMTGHSFSNTMKVTYSDGGGTAIAELADGGAFYVAETTENTLKLTTNPRLLQYSFNGNTAVANTTDFITIRHNLVDNDVVQYYTDTGNTAITGLSNAGQYFVVSANNLGIKLSATRGGGAIDITAGVTESGHNIVITTINMTDGPSENHSLAQVNET